MSSSTSRQCYDQAEVDDEPLEQKPILTMIAPPPPPPPEASLDLLLARLSDICRQDLDDDGTRSCKDRLRRHPLFDAMYDVLCEKKAKMVMPIVERQEDERFAEAQNHRLDNMLIAEGVMGNSSTEDPNQTTRPASAEDDDRSANSADQNDEEYRIRLQHIRQQFHEEANNFQNQCAQFGEHISVLLRDQSAIRPMGGSDAARALDGVERRFRQCATYHKQITCERVMLLKSKFLDARRKRRNFSKAATQILNEYFQSHLSHPYPSEEIKEELALKCNITISQVSNWFGNKRIRYKKTMSRHDEEQHLQNSIQYDPYLPLPLGETGIIPEHAMYTATPGTQNMGFVDNSCNYAPPPVQNLLCQAATYDMINSPYETGLAAAQLSYQQLQ